MKKKPVIHATVLICLIILAGFVVPRVINNNINSAIFEGGAEHVATLTSESVYYQLEALFAKPISASLTMAHDALLKSFLLAEADHTDDPEFTRTMSDYLASYQVNHGFDSVFLVSARTNHYYHTTGLNRTLSAPSEENQWYYDFLASEDAYALNIDNDEAGDDSVTVFINCRITGADGATLGIVGVGFAAGELQALLASYTSQYNVQAYLLNGDGVVQLSSDQTAYVRKCLFDEDCYQPLREAMMRHDGDTPVAFWHELDGESIYFVLQFIPDLSWYLVVEYSYAEMQGRLNAQVTREALVAVVVSAIVLAVVIGVLRMYNKRVVELATLREQRHQEIFKQETAQLYEEIHELNITRNRAQDEKTFLYFEKLGMPGDIPFDQALQVIARKQIKEEFRQAYIDTFTPENVLRAFENGITSLSYDLMISGDGRDYYWMRVTGRIYHWAEDGTIRMFTYRQNIDSQKRQEASMMDRMQRDSLSGAYNKGATEELIDRMIQDAPQRPCALLILDIDDFKHVNDDHGHAVGDQVIAEFSRILRENFRKSDIIGRIGGDEFVAFLPIPSEKWVEGKARALSKSLNTCIAIEGKEILLSASIGIAIGPAAGESFAELYRHADQALYQTKERGKNGYTVWAPLREGGSPEA